MLSYGNSAYVQSFYLFIIIQTNPDIGCYEGESLLETLDLERVQQTLTGPGTAMCCWVWHGIEVEGLKGYKEHDNERKSYFPIVTMSVILLV